MKISYRANAPNRFLSQCQVLAGGFLVANARDLRPLAAIPLAGIGSAASEGGSVRGSPCDESARLRSGLPASLRPHSFGLLRSPEAAKRRAPPFTGDTPGTFLSQVAR